MVHLPNGLNQCVYLFILFNYIIKEGACSFLNKLNLPLIFLLQPTKKIIFAFHLTYHIPSIFQETFHPESHSTITFIHQFDLLQKAFAGTQYKLFSPVTRQCKCAYGQIIQKSRVPFETGSALAHLGVIPRDLLTQIHTSNYVPDLFLCGPKLVASPSSGVGKGATSSSKHSLICFRSVQLGSWEGLKCIA